MKTSLKIAFLFAALFAMTACSAQRRAERHIRKAVALCPELVQVKAHPIDTVLTAPGFADCTRVPLPKVLQGDTVYAATDHGTVLVSLCQSDSTLRVGFVAAPQEIPYRDTLRYAEIVPHTDVVPKENDFWVDFIIGCVLILLGFAFAICMLRNK